VLCAVLIQTQD